MQNTRTRKPAREIRVLDSFDPDREIAQAIREIERRTRSRRSSGRRKTEY